MADAAQRRTSQFCRIIGNPIAYGIVRLLDGKRRRPKDLSRILGVSATTIVNQLKHLKIAGVVHYRATAKRRAGRKVEYWLADRRVGRSLDGLERTLRDLK